MICSISTALILREGRQLHKVVGPPCVRPETISSGNSSEQIIRVVIITGWIRNKTKSWITLVAQSPSYADLNEVIMEVFQSGTPTYQGGNDGFSNR